MKRINKLITADAHAVIDSIEDPFHLLKQSMREMSTIIEEQETNLKQIKLNIEQFKLQGDRLLSELESIVGG